MATNDKLIDDIISAITIYGDRDAVSSVMETLRENGWKRLGSTEDFIYMCKNLGFTIERVPSKCGKHTRATYITI